jgi:hypothetical protein
MTGQITIALGCVLAAVAAAWVVRRRRAVDPPTQPRQWTVPAQLNRADFGAPTEEWLVVVFSSATCTTCADVVNKVAVVASRHVAVRNVEYSAEQALHRRYGIDAVPTLVIADGEGVVRGSFLGPVTATDLWAAIAECRQPGSSPEPELGH